MKEGSHRNRWLTRLTRALPPDDQAALLGDLQEEVGFSRSVIEIMDFAARQEIARYSGLRPWVVLTFVVVCAMVLGAVSLGLADESAIYVWFFANNWDAELLQQSGFRVGLRESLCLVLLWCSALVCWSWSCGYVIGRLSRRPLRIEMVPVCVIFGAIWCGWRPPTLELQVLPLARDFPGNTAVFQNAFYGSLFSPIIQSIFVLIPLVSGSMSGGTVGIEKKWFSIVSEIAVGVCIATLPAQASLWWQIRTWETSPLVMPHLPSVLPFALAGSLALVLTRSKQLLSGMKPPPLRGV